MHTLIYTAHPDIERATKAAFYSTQVEKADRVIAKLKDEIADLSDCLRERHLELRWWESDRAKSAALMAEVGEHP
jgi:hypothetical protein